MYKKPDLFSSKNFKLLGPPLIFILINFSINAVRALTTKDQVIHQDYRKSIQQVFSNHQHQQLSQLVDSIIENKQLTLELKEAFIYSIVTQLRNAKSSKVVNTLLKRLSRYQSQILRPHHDIPQISGEPKYNIAATAKSILDSLQRQSFKQKYQNDLISGTKSIFKLFLSQSDTSKDALKLEQKGAIDALSEVAVAHLAPIAEKLLESYQKELDPVRLELSIILKNSALAKQLLSHSSSIFSQKLITQANQLFDFEHSFNLLVIATHKDKLASLALTEMSNLSLDKRVTSFLFKQLSNPKTGSSAAFALARYPDPQITQQLITHLNQLEHSSDSLLRNRLLLSLYQLKNSQATSALIEFANDRTQPIEIRKEVKKWLN